MIECDIAHHCVTWVELVFHLAFACELFSEKQALGVY